MDVVAPSAEHYICVDRCNAELRVTGEAFIQTISVRVPTWIPLVLQLEYARRPAIDPLKSKDVSSAASRV